MHRHAHTHAHTHVQTEKVNYFINNNYQLSAKEHTSTRAEKMHYMEHCWNETVCTVKTMLSILTWEYANKH